MILPEPIEANSEECAGSEVAPYNPYSRRKFLKEASTLLIGGFASEAVAALGRTHMQQFAALMGAGSVSNTVTELAEKHIKQIDALRRIIQTEINGGAKMENIAEGFSWFPQLEHHFYNWVRKHRIADTPPMQHPELMQWIALWLGVHVRYDEVESQSEFRTIVQGDFAMRTQGTNRAHLNFPDNIPVKKQNPTDDKALNIYARCGGIAAFITLLLARIRTQADPTLFETDCIPQEIALWMTKRWNIFRRKDWDRVLHYCVAAGYPETTWVLGDNRIGFPTFQTAAPDQISQKMCHVNDAHAASPIFEVVKNDESSTPWGRGAKRD